VHSPEDPWVVLVNFKVEPSETGVTWALSLDLFLEAFTSPSEELQGSGDVLIEVGENYSFIHLSNGRHASSVKFSTADIREFLNQVDVSSSEKIVGQKLDEFLGAL
jgi:hypothetical protein